MTDRVIIFDTTLRDGEQALKASLTVKEKLQIALALERLGVDVMEVGFPVSSQGDFESVQTIARHIKNSRVAALSRAVDKDIDAAYEALKVAEAFRIHTFIASSALHVEAKLKRSFDDVVGMAVAAVKRARNYTDDVEFSCEDAGRTGIDNINIRSRLKGYDLVSSCLQKLFYRFQFIGVYLAAQIMKRYLFPHVYNLRVL